MRGVGVCAWARVLAAPCHFWLGCWGVCVFVAAPRLYPATLGWGVRCGCLCSGSGFGCAPPLLAGVLGVFVFVGALRVYPANPGWGVQRGCVRLGFGCGCAPPLLAGVLGRWGVCVFLCALRLYPATLGWGLRRGCASLGSGFGCALPLLAWALGCVCVCGHAPLAPRHSWLGCAVWVCVRGVGFRLLPSTPGWGVGACVSVCTFCLYPATPGWGVLWGCLCLGSGFGCAPPRLAGVLGCVCVFVGAPRLYPAYPGWGVRCGRVCSGWGFGCAPPLLAGPLRCVCVCGGAPLVPCHSWLGCAVWVCVLGLGFRLRPAAPGWGVGVLGCVCVCVRAPLVPRHSWLGFVAWVCVLGAGFLLRPATPGLDVGVCVCLWGHPVCTPPLLAGVCGVGVCAWAWVAAAPRHSWLGSWGVGVCVCVCVRAPLVPSHSWLGFAAWVCVFGVGFWLRPATPGLDVRPCVCLWGRPVCTPPLLAWVCGVGVCAWAWVSCCAPPLLAGVLGYWGVCVFVCALRLYAATPGSGSRRGCVCSGPGFSCAPPLLAGVLGCVCVFAGAPRLYPATPGWGVRGRCVCLGLGCGCAPPLLAGVLGCCGVCVFVCALRLYPATPGWGSRRGCVCLGSGFGCALPLLACTLGCVCVFRLAPLAPRDSWLGCAVWVCVPGLEFRLRPATPGWGVGACVSVCTFCSYPATPCWVVLCGCVCSGSGFGCAPPLLAGVLGCVCRCAPSACTSPFLGGVCGLWVGCCLAPVPVPWFVAGCAGCPGLRHPVAVVAWHLSLCLGCGRRRASLACLVAPLWCAAPRLVRSLAVLRSAFPTPWCLFPIPGAYAPGFTGRLRGARGGRPKTGLLVPAAGRCQGSGAGLAPRCTRSGPRNGVVPGRSLRCWSWAACAAVVWRVLTWSLMRPVSRTARLSPGDSAGALGLFCVDADTAPFGSEGATPGSRACVRVRALLGRIGRAGLPAAFWCASLFLWPVSVRSLFVRPPPGWGLICLWLWLGFFSLFFSPSLLRPRCFLLSLFSGPGCPGRWRLVPPPSPPPFLFFFPCFYFDLCFFFFAPAVSGVSCFRPRVPWASAPRCPPPPVFYFLPPSRLFFFSCFSFGLWFFAACAVRGWFVCLGLSGVLVCASVVLSLWLLFVRCSLAPLALAGVVWCCLLCLGVCCWAWLSSVVSWWVLVSCFGGAVAVWPRGSPPCGLMWCVLVFCCPALCSVALCCRVVVCCRALLFVCVVACACCLFPAAAHLLFVFWGVGVCVPCPLRPVRCCAALCWCPCVVLSASSVLFLVPGVVGSWCRRLLLGVRWWLWLPGVVVWCCVSALVNVSGLAVARRLPCGVLLPCVVSCGAVLPCGAVLWCPVVAFFLFFSLLVALVFCFPFKISCKTRENCFPFLKIN